MSSADGVVARLRAALPDVITDPDVVAAHSVDHAQFCDPGPALALVRPASTAEVSEVLRIAAAHRVPVVPQGARTGLSGGATAIGGGILLSLARMRRILEINETEQLAVVEAGVTNAELSRAVAERGLCYPPDPSSWEESTIGGNVATNAGGLCCVKYGVTSDYVRGLEVVLADGAVVRTGRRTAKGVAGYDLTRLLVGSEGTLGVISEVTVRLVPAPAPALTAVALFAALGDACDAVADIMASGPPPALLELMDAASIRAVNDFRDLGLPVGAQAMLLVRSDRGGEAPADLERFAKICAARGATETAVADTEAESRMLLEARRLVNPATEALGHVLVDDVCVPRGRLRELVDGVAAIGERHGVFVTCLGHAGDGNMHPSVIYPAGDPSAAERAYAAFGDIMALGLRLGGTITGEHGVGSLKARWLAEEVGPRSVDLHRGIKAVFDPLGILNPGKVFAAR